MLVWHEFLFPDEFEPQGVWICPGRMTKDQVEQMRQKNPGAVFTQNDACPFHVHPDEQQAEQSAKAGRLDSPCTGQVGSTALNINF